MERGVLELGEGDKGFFPPSYIFYGPMQVYCQRLGLSAGGLTPGGSVPELSYSCICSPGPALAEGFELKSAFAV